MGDRELLRLEKEVRIGYGKGRRSYVSVVREHYLRDDIPCKSEACVLCAEITPPDQPLLSLAASHYAIPDVHALRDYLEVFEHPGLSGLVLLQTALSHLRNKVGRASHSRAQRLLSGRGVVFSNEHHLETFVGREPGESIAQWQQRLVWRAGLWYASHLQAAGKSVSIIILSPEPQSYSPLMAGGVSGLQVMGVAEYLSTHWPQLGELTALVESLEASLQGGGAEREERRGEHSEHLPEQALLEGVKKGLFLAGSLRVSRYHPRDEAFLTPHPSSLTSHPSQVAQGDVLIWGSDSRNRAIHGDTVAVQLLPRSEWKSRSNALSHAPGVGGEQGGDHAPSEAKPTGVVVGILQRICREYVASFAEAAENTRGRTEKVLVYPYDIRIPRVRISTRQARELRNHRIVIRIDSWGAESQYPNGHFVRSIGKIGTVETETAAILIEHQLSTTPFSRALLQELPSPSAELPWRVSEEEAGLRRDLRHSHLIFSIDPRGCEDVDDTLSVRHLKHGVTELGVHIADVSFFVPPGGLTDRDARDRSTTIYLADRRYDMLPAVLSANLCSLLSNVDRYAVSVLWRLDSNWEVKDVWYGRTVIRSTYKLAYETAQALCDGVSAAEVLGDVPELSGTGLTGDEVNKRVEKLRAAIRSLVEIARVVHHRRSEGGALELEGVEVKVQLSDSDKTDIEDLIPRQPLEMHETVAECMIFANHWVARRLLQTFPSSSLLRRHPPPDANKFSNLVGCAGARGFPVETSSNKSLAASLDACHDPADPNVNKLLRMLATQAMSQAEYFSTGSLPPDQFHHYGLALDHYTHFTSPIRRYADLVVHRQLLAAVGQASSEGLPTSQQLEEQARHMNNKHRAAQLAQMASTELFQALYFTGQQDSSRREVGGVIYALRTNGVLVFIPRYGVRGPVYLRDKSGLVTQPAPHPQEGVVFATGTLEKSEHCITITHASGQYSLGLFDHIRVGVRVEVPHAHAPSLSFQLLSCKATPPSATPTSSLESMPKKELVKTVTSESADARSQKAMDSLLALNSAMYRIYQQSEPSKSLYCLVQDLYRLSLADDV